ncbi:MAG: lipoprotein-releasing system ATP-binding protein LolD [Bacteroidetes bacterium HGW-Bacteroidetes-21]|jgi:lipoprotein-releasing system ATP-binding protein|nr:MAG: lipoprotein-releasing system ATP-binding protein LolD [Bacteroidetes bacterium HGW-Bacteroidetes-21]
MVKAENLNKFYGEYHALKDVSLEIKQGEIVSIVGASGAGKTTLLQILGTLQNPDSGEIIFNDISIKKLSQNQLARFRNEHIGFVFQFHHLLPEFTALENVCLPGYIYTKSKKEVEARAKDLLTFLGLSERLTHKPSELSGGEKQRVAIARALINKPTVVLADEPSGNLDSNNTQELYSLILSLREQYNQTFIIVTHNNELANVSDRILVMKDGAIIEETTSILT